MTISEKKQIAIFMNFPTKTLKGRITNELAKKSYNDMNSLFSVIKKLETISFPDKYGDYEPYVVINRNWCSIKLSRQRKNTGFKNGAFDELFICHNEGKSKEEAIQKSIIDFLNWMDGYNSVKNKQ